VRPPRFISLISTRLIAAAAGLTLTAFTVQFARESIHPDNSYSFLFVSLLATCSVACWSITLINPSCSLRQILRGLQYAVLFGCVGFMAGLLAPRFSETEGSGLLFAALVTGPISVAAGMLSGVLAPLTLRQLVALFTTRRMLFQPCTNAELLVRDIPATSSSTQWLELADFAQTFNGWEYWRSTRKCIQVARKQKPRTLTELRTKLFFRFRAWRHSYYMGDATVPPDICELVESIREMVRRREIE
jgi:hypothetical protein